MSALRLILSVLTAITKIPGLLRWIGSLFEKSFEERLEEIKIAEENLKSAQTPLEQDEALKKITRNLNSSNK
jgi:hypothetical protein